MSARSVRSFALPVLGLAACTLGEPAGSSSSHALVSTESVGIRGAIAAPVGGRVAYRVRGETRVLDVDPELWIVSVEAGARGDLARSAWETVTDLEPIATLEDARSTFFVVRATTDRMRALPTPLRERAQHVYRDHGTLVLPSDRVVVRFVRSIDASTRARALQQLRAETIETFPTDTIVARVRGDSIAAARAIAQTGLVDFAEPDLGELYELRSFVPTDPFYARQWHLESGGATPAAADADVDAEGAWSLTIGSPDIVVAIVDSGVDPAHEDLDGCKQLPGYDAVLDAPGAADHNGHGTACAGVAAAWANNGRGVAGACPSCRVLPIRLGLGFDAVSVLGTTPLALGVYQIAWDTHVARAFEHAVATGASVISNSWGPLVASGPRPLSSIAAAALARAHTDGRGGLGAVVLFAAGNEGTRVELDAWASTPSVMAIAASNDQDRRSGYSNYGAAISVAAPSNGIAILDGARTTGIWTTDITGGEGYNAATGLREPFGDALGSYTARFGGTSSATPLVAGIAGLVLSANRSLTDADVREVLQSTADRIDPTGGEYDASGHSLYYGFGKVSAARAVAAAVARRTSASVGDACAGACSGAAALCRPDPVFGDYCTHGCIGDGECPTGYACRDDGTGALSCARALACTVPELCNARDDDGDGSIDEGCADTCGGETAEGRCEGEALVYCDAGRVGRVDCGAVRAHCGANAALSAQSCAFDCPETPPETGEPSWCAGSLLIQCRYGEVLGRQQLRGVRVSGCAESCGLVGAFPACTCAATPSCDASVASMCIDGKTTRVPCASGCEMSGTEATCSCPTTSTCAGDDITYCDGTGRTRTLTCPEGCGTGALLGTTDCVCDPAIDPRGTCAPDGQITLCIGGETVHYACPETCAILTTETLFGSAEQATCTCSDIPPEGRCDGLTVRTCPLGYRGSFECARGCGWVLDAGSLEEAHLGCLCEGLSGSIGCVGNDVTACLDDGTTVSVPCAELEPGTDTCIAAEAPDGGNPFEMPPVRCVASGADASVAADASADGGTPLSPPGEDGCGCRAAGKSRPAQRSALASCVALALALLCASRKRNRRSFHA